MSFVSNISSDEVTTAELDAACIMASFDRNGLVVLN